MNPRTFILTLVLYFLASLSKAQTIEKPFFYEISRGSSKGVILGTIHGGVGLEELPLKVQIALAKAGTVLVELVPAHDQVDLFLLDYSAALLKYGNFEGSPLTDRQKNILIQKWGSSKQLADGATSNSCFVLNYLSLPTKKFLDLKILHNSYRYKKNLVQLDSGEIFLDFENENSQVAPEACDLGKLLEQDPLKIKNDVNLVIHNYKAGNEARFQTLDAEILFRNKRWLPIIEERLNQSDVFIAVGVSHLLGSQGLLNLLHEKGYSIHRVLKN